MAHNELVADPARSVKILALGRNEARATSMFGEGGDVTILHWDASATSTEGYPKVDYVIHCANMTDSTSFIEHPVEVIETTTNGARSMHEYDRPIVLRVMRVNLLERVEATVEASFSSRNNCNRRLVALSVNDVL